MFIWNSSLIFIVLRTLIVYFAFLIGLRLLGTRALGQATMIDLVLLLLISNAVQNAMIGPDTSITGGLVSALTLLGANYGVARLSDIYPQLRRLTAGEPVVLVRNGHVVVQTCAHSRVTSEDIEESVREHGFANLRDVRLAVLEIDGSISVVGKDAQPVSISAQTVKAQRHRRRIRGHRRQ